MDWGIPDSFQHPTESLERFPSHPLHESFPGTNQSKRQFVKGSVRLVFLSEYVGDVGVTGHVFGVDDTGALGVPDGHLTNIKVAQFLQDVASR
jgi:hypothetical protein